jgi:hypothetical protein
MGKQSGFETKVPDDAGRQNPKKDVQKDVSSGNKSEMVFAFPAPETTLAQPQVRL